ncbi:MAG: ankyrin repeat domain-containing protein [Bacteroidia bacterium]|jgi:ankyrin repeat protein|nr:ankyrin repeat domain-containing protein [Bacteroidia bacterium]
MSAEYSIQRALLSNNLTLLKNELLLHNQPVVWGSGITILHYYIQNAEKITLSSSEIISTIISLGVPIDFGNRDGYSALHFAVSSNNPDLVKALIFKGANVNLKSSSGNTPVWRAFMDFRGLDSQRMIISFLLENGADLTIGNNSGISPLSMLERMKGDKYNEEKYNTLTELINKVFN